MKLILIIKENKINYKTYNCVTFVTDFWVALYYNKGSSAGYNSC